MESTFNFCSKINSQEKKNQKVVFYKFSTVLRENFSNIQSCPCSHYFICVFHYVNGCFFVDEMANYFKGKFLKCFKVTLTNSI